MEKLLIIALCDIYNELCMLNMGLYYCECVLHG